MHKMIERRLRSLPPVSSVVPQSIPVPCFGDCLTARVATLGINPSKLEFTDSDGALLLGRDARFVSLAAINRGSLRDATAADLVRVYEGCRSYFTNRPYWRWFGRLEQQVNAVGGSYLNGSAVHLDLAHWATDPTWGSLPRSDRNQLIADGRGLLEWQLSLPEMRVVLLNGRTVLTSFAAWSGSRFETVAEFEGLRGQVASLVRSMARGAPTVLGWSVNLQSSFGVTLQFRRSLATVLAQVANKVCCETGRSGA